MTAVVLDASATLRALNAHERGNAEARDLLRALVGSGIEPVAPDLFAYEIGHAITRATGTDEARAALLTRATSIVRLVRPSANEHRAALDLALEQRISFYDASYVVRARSDGATLWTEDRELLAKFPDVAEDTATLRARSNR